MLTVGGCLEFIRAAMAQPEEFTTEDADSLAAMLLRALGMSGPDADEIADRALPVVGRARPVCASDAVVGGQSATIPLCAELLGLGGGRSPSAGRSSSTASRSKRWTSCCE